MQGVIASSRDPLRGSAWSRCKNPWFFPIFNMPVRPSAGISVVEVQKCSFLRFPTCPRDPLRGSAWSRCKKQCFFCDFCGAHATLCGDRHGRGPKTHVFFAISALLARPSAGIGVVEVQKLEVFCDFCCSNWSSGVVSWFARLLPEPAGRGFDSSLVRGRASQDATCILKQLAQSNLRRATCAEQVAQSNLRRATCTDQFAQSALPRATCAEKLTQSNLRRATCAEQLAQSKLHRATCAEQLAPTSLRRAPCLEQLAQRNLRGATCTEQLAQSNLQGAQLAQSNLQGATCRDQLAGATCAEQLAQSNLHSATCVEQLAQTNLHRPVCAEHLAWCCLALASRSVGKKNASCSVGPTSLAMFCFRANRGLV